VKLSVRLLKNLYIALCCCSGIILLGMCYILCTSSSPPDFHSNFSLSITDDDPRTVREAVDSEDGNLWKRAMEE
jgi:hypothetical protein